MNRPRILHIIKATGLAGAERHLLILLSGLRREGFDARLLILTNPGDVLESFFDQARQREIPVDGLVIRCNADLSLFIRLRNYIKRIAPVIVHTHLIHGDLFGIIAARWAGVPLVLTTRHNDDGFRYRTPCRQLNRYLWQRVQAGIAVSNAISRFSVEVEDAPAGKIFTVHHGVELAGTAEGHEIPINDIPAEGLRSSVRSQLGIDARAPVAGIFCRLTKQKGIRFGLQAIALLTRQLPDVKLVIAGEGPLQKKLHREADRLGLSDRIIWLGWREDVPRLLAAIDLLLAPSLFEGFGLIFLDAMAGGIPIVSSTASAIPEVVIDGATGFLVPPRDVDGMATAMYKLLSDPDLCRQMGQNGRERLNQYFGARRMVGKTIDIYNKLLIEHSDAVSGSEPA